MKKKDALKSFVNLSCKYATYNMTSRITKIITKTNI